MEAEQPTNTPAPTTAPTATTQQTQEQLPFTQRSERQQVEEAATSKLAQLEGSVQSLKSEMKGREVDDMPDDWQEEYLTKIKEVKEYKKALHLHIDTLVREGFLPEENAKPYKKAIDDRSNTPGRIPTCGYVEASWEDSKRRDSRAFEEKKLLQERLERHKTERDQFQAELEGMKKKMRHDESAPQHQKMPAFASNAFAGLGPLPSLGSSSSSSKQEDGRVDLLRINDSSLKEVAPRRVVELHWQGMFDTSAASFMTNKQSAEGYETMTKYVMQLLQQ